MERVVVAVICLAEVRTEDVSSHVVIKEGIHRTHIGQLQTVLHGTTFNLQQRFLVPVFGEEDETSEDLFGRKAVIGAFATELLGEVKGEGL